MEWNAARILWDQQIMLMLLLLTPIFLLAAVLVFAGPHLVAKKKKGDSNRAPQYGPHSPERSR